MMSPPATSVRAPAPACQPGQSCPWIAPLLSLMSPAPGEKAARMGMEHCISLFAAIFQPDYAAVVNISGN